MADGSSLWYLYPYHIPLPSDDVEEERREDYYYFDTFLSI
jgi:hypothetical protein